MNEYTDILYLSHYEFLYHPRMSIANRAAQFAPFDALTGYKEAVFEKGRKTTPYRILTDDVFYDLNQKMEKLKNGQKIRITYFLPDELKIGGKYLEEEVILKKIDAIQKKVYFQNHFAISFWQILNIEI